jgi:hypothetical protein
VARRPGLKLLDSLAVLVARFVAVAAALVGMQRRAVLAAQAAAMERLGPVAPVVVADQAQ